MGLAQKHLPNYTYTDYLRWKGRWEVIAGIAYDMTQSKMPIHQKFASKISALFSNVIAFSKCNYTIYCPIDLYRK